MNIRINTDLAAGLLGLVIAAALWFPREEMSRLSLIFPRAIIAITALVSIILCIKAFISPSERKVSVEGSPARIAVMIAILFLWWLLIGYLGFVTSTFFVFVGLVWYLARIERRVTSKVFLRWVPVVAILIGVFYLAFTEILQVSLPLGLFI